MEYRFGHMFDAFQALESIANGNEDLSSWAASVAQLLGEDHNLAMAWPEAAGFAAYFTVDQPHRTEYLQPSLADNRALIDRDGNTYPAFMFRKIGS